MLYLGEQSFDVATSTVSRDTLEISVESCYTSAAVKK